MQTQSSSGQVQVEPYMMPKECLHAKAAPQNSVECYVAMQCVTSPPTPKIVEGGELEDESGNHGVESSLEFGGTLETSLEFRASEGTSLDFGVQAPYGVSPRSLSSRIDKEGENELEQQPKTEDEKPAPASDLETCRAVVNTHYEHIH